MKKAILEFLIINLLSGLDVKGIYNEFDQQSFFRRMQVESFGRKIWLCTPEDAIISKLIYGSPKDILDAKGILLRQKDKLDYDYLTKYSKVYKVGEDYRRILQEISTIVKGGKENQ